MIKIKQLFLISLLIYSCTNKKGQSKGELKEISVQLIENLLNCYQSLESVQPLTEEGFFIQFNTEENNNKIKVNISIIEKELIYGESKPDIIGRYKQFDVYAYGTGLETFFKIQSPMELLLNFEKTNENELVIYDPIYLKATYSVDGTKKIDIKYSPCEMSE